MIEYSNEFGRIEFRTLPLPAFMTDVSGTYTCSGKVLVQYQTADDPDDPDFVNLAVLDDDGTHFHPIFSGVIKPGEKSNGIRYMVFQDNKRILLGDWILECEPDLDTCVKANLVPLQYPEWLTKSDGIWLTWSEVIIAPDNVHMSWSTLSDSFAASYLGALKREPQAYVLEGVQKISSTEMYQDDPHHPGCVIPLPVRGGEVKQFVRGGSALSLVGAGEGIAGSVLQALDSEELLFVTRVPGYDETTIFSPDEQLGLVMSTRFSPKTNCAVLGLVPRPYDMPVRSALIMPVYLYAVAGVRAFREGNIGPALIDLQKSMTTPGYLGFDLHDKEEKWVYYSPMSWHPEGKKAMWNERVRLSLPHEGRRSRIRIAELLDREPGEPVRAVPVPENIPYAEPGGPLKSLPMRPFSKIMGRKSGSMTCQLKVTDEMTWVVSYNHFSDDGQTFINGTESASAGGLTQAGKTVLTANLSVSGAHEGKMALRVTFERSGIDEPTKISFRPAADGNPESFGFASYDGVTLKVSDLLE